MARTSPSPTQCRFSSDQTRRRLSMYGVRKFWDAFHQSSKRQNDDLSSLCEGTESSSLRLLCIPSFLVCLNDSACFSVCFSTLFAVLLSLWALLHIIAEKGLVEWCSRTLICERIGCRVGVGIPHIYYPCKSSHTGGRKKLSSFVLVLVLACTVPSVNDLDPSCPPSLPSLLFSGTRTSAISGTTIPILGSRPSPTPSVFGPSLPSSLLSS